MTIKIWVTFPCLHNAKYTSGTGCGQLIGNKKTELQTTCTDGWAIYRLFWVWQYLCNYILSQFSVSTEYELNVINWFTLEQSWDVLDQLYGDVNFAKKNESHFPLGGYVNKQSCHIWDSENPNDNKFLFYPLFKLLGSTRYSIESRRW